MKIDILLKPKNLIIVLSLNCKKKEKKHHKKEALGSD